MLLMGFMTTIPVGGRFEATDEDFGKALAMAPVVGLVIGTLLALSGWLLGMLFPAGLVAVMVFIIYVLITGGLHLDGLGDTFDGVFSGRSKERMLEIMRDSRIGTNALLAVVSVILLDVSLLASIKAQAGSIASGENFYLIVFLLFPVAGRIGSLTAAAASTYARSGEGLGKSFIDCCGKRELLIGLVLYFGIFAGIAGLEGLIVAVVPPVSAYVCVKLLGRRVGGATGDILGAVCEINQVVFLVEVFLLIRFLAIS